MLYFNPQLLIYSIKATTTKKSQTSFCIPAFYANDPLGKYSLNPAARCDNAHPAV